MHNTSVNKLGYTPLKLVTGKSVTLPGLGTGNASTESLNDCEAVQKTLETFNKITVEFCKAEMRKKLKRLSRCKSTILSTFGQLP